jgi:predicted lysophospholipase L1 biosynthesis ABC-type transport system permease subunit
MLTESVLLSSFGGAAGLLLGYLGRNVVPRLLTNSSRPELEQIQFDWRVLLFTMGISFATGILFGLAPAWQATRIAVHAGLRDSGGANANRHKLWFDKSLVISQIALSAMLLMGAGLSCTPCSISIAFHWAEWNHIPLFRLSLPAPATVTQR